MVAAQYFCYLVDGLVSILFLECRAVYSLKMGDGEDLLLNGRVGRKDEVVLVHTHAVISFAFQHSDNAEGELLKPYDLADGVLSVGEEVVYDGLPNDADLRRRLDVLFGEHISVLHLVATYLKIVGAYAVNGGRSIVGAVDCLPAAVYRRRDGRDVARLVYDVLIVFQLQRLHGGGILPHAATHIGSGVYHNHVRAHLAYLCLYAPLRALPDGKHRNHGGNADDNTEHREESAQLIVRQCAEGYFYEVCSVHVE